MVLTMYPALCQACSTPLGGRLTGSFSAAPALTLFLWPWVWGPERQPLPVAEAALGPVW